LNLDDWGIALPVNDDCQLKGKRAQIKAGKAVLKNYQNKYFYADKDKKSVMFEVPAEGHAAASKNGSPRVELESGDPPSDRWLPTDKTMHCLSQQMIVHKVLEKEKSLTVSQMHGDKSDLIKVRWVGEGLSLEMPSPDHIHHTLVKTIGLGNKFTTDICVQDGNAIFWVNGKNVYTYKNLNLKGVVSDKGGYMIMHAGAYSPGAGSSDDRAVMELFSLTVGTKCKYCADDWANATIV